MKRFNVSKIIEKIDVVENKNKATGKPNGKFTLTITNLTRLELAKLQTLFEVSEKAWTVFKERMVK